MSDIIVAVATPRGKGGIAVVRLSGDGAATLLPKLFSPIPKKLKYRYMYYGTLIAGDVSDKGLAVVFSSPASYTGEETVELHCHGGEIMANLLVGAAVRAGARPAQPGEFTRRAFLNGKISLCEAEAVGNMIEADSTAAAKVASQALSGGLGDKITDFQNRITDMLAGIEASVDYPDEVEEQSLRLTLIPQIKDLCDELDRLISTYRVGRIMKDGFSVCLIGKPNAGKSSLLNALCGRECAIVTPLAGTTRDVLHETVELCGVAVHIYDTAGLRAPEGEIEKIGVEKAIKQAENADLVIYVIDSTTGFDDEDKRAIDGIKGQFIVVYNKTDAAPPPAGGLGVSALTGDALGVLREAIANRLDCTADGIFIASERHLDALRRAKDALERAKTSQLPLDCVSLELHESWQALGAITGQTVNEEIIDRIFSKFCVGK